MSPQRVTALWLGAVFFSLPIAVAQAPSAAQIADLEKRVLDSRREIHSGRVVLTVRNPVAPQPDVQRLVKSYELFFRGDWLRADLHASAPGDQFSSQTVFTPNVLIRATGAFKTVQWFGPASKPEKTLEVPDPRGLGLIAWFFDTLNQFPYERHFQGANRHDLQLTKGVRDGEPAWKVSYRTTTPSGKDIFTEYWVAPESGYQPLSIVVSSGEGTERNVNSIECTLAQFELGKVWFPKTVTYRREHGGELRYEQVVTIEDGEFGCEIQDDAFTLAGLGLGVGREVNVDGKRMIWTGQGLRP